MYSEQGHKEKASLQDRNQRANLESQAKPYWEKLTRGHYLGYYKGARRSSWHARMFMGTGRYLETKLGAADDVGQESNEALSYAQAVEKAYHWFHSFDRPDKSTADGRKYMGSDESIPPVSRLKSERLDEVRVAWATERPDLSLRHLGLFLRLEHAHYLHEQRLTHIARTIGVNIGDMHVLLALRRGGSNYSMRPTDLFRTLLVTSGAMTKRIDRLEALGLVRRISADDDRRSELVQLTPEGSERAETAITIIDKNLNAIVRRSGLTQAHLQQMDESLQILLSVMDGFQLQDGIQSQQR